ncbi:hypothetical protein [Xanthomonas theicola]|uniref:hypothetical protein n=1 Tax=Xanthomonas theicola TaxID=56464 RepID=UPI000FF8B452|nr:hypothetical protein [Xanthomonas theicola]QNH27193.1 hypothetical protein G4Q83_22235 [Xanthomonas theicola]
MTNNVTTYTAFCRDVHRVHPSTWISKVEAVDLEAAKQAAREECASDWMCEPADVAVMGMATGDVAILEWED